MRILLALLFAARIGGMGMTVVPPDGWTAVGADVVPTPAPFNRVVVLKNGDAVIQVSRTTVPPEWKGKSPAEILKFVQPAADAHDTTIAGMPASRADQTAIALHGDYIYLFLGSGPAFEEVLRSAELNNDPIRIEGNGISMLLPDGWRQLDARERDELKPEMKPQNALQEKAAREKASPQALIIKHDFQVSTLAASVQARRVPMPPKLKLASSMEVARVLAAASIAGFRGTFEVEPHDVTIAGMPAAEYVQRYKLVEAQGTHEMRAHFVIVSRGNDYYLIGYAGPAEDEADAKVFKDVVLKSLKLAK